MEKFANIATFLFIGTLLMVAVMMGNPQTRFLAFPLFAMCVWLLSPKTMR